MRINIHRTFLVLLAVIALSACQSTRIPYGRDISPIRRYSDIAARQTERQQFVVYDPAEGFNKGVYKFNAKLDRYAFLPVADGYKKITPPIVQRSISNFFLNIGEVPSFTNAILQASPKKAAITASRFAINTTVGLLGTVDVATKWGIDRRPEDFGQTLGRWGSGPGPYLVLPVLGPSNLRDVTGSVFDLATLSLLIPNDVESNAAYQVAAYGVMPVNARAQNSFRYYESGSPFEYELVRFISTKARALQIAK